MQIRRLIGVTVGLTVLTGGLVGCANVRNNSAEFACAYGGGPIERKSRKGEFGPSDRSYTGVFDTVYKVPADKRNWVFSSQQIGQTEPARQFSAVMADSIPMLFEGSVDLKFYGPQVCDLVDQVRNKYDLGDAGQRQQFLDIEFGTAMETAFNRVSKRYTWEPVYENTAVEGELPTQEQFAAEVGVEAQKVFRERLSDIDALCGPQVDAAIDPEEAGACTPPLVTLTKAEPPAQCGDREDCVELTERRQVEEQARAEANARIAQATEANRAAQESKDAAVAQARADQARLDAELETAKRQAQLDNAACIALALSGGDCVAYIQAKALEQAAANGDFPDVVGGDPAIILGAGQP